MLKDSSCRNNFLKDKQQGVDQLMHKIQEETEDILSYLLECMLNLSLDQNFKNTIIEDSDMFSCLLNILSRTDRPIEAKIIIYKILSNATTDALTIVTLIN